MSLQFYLRLALVGLILSVVGCLPDVSVVPLGDITDDSKIQMQVFENVKSVSPAIQSPVRGRLQRQFLQQFNSKNQLPRTNLASYSQRNDGNAKNPSFSRTVTRASSDVLYYHSVPNKVQTNTNRRNNPVEFSSVKFNDGIDAKRSYALQTVRQDQNLFDFKGSQMGSSDPNIAQRLVRKNAGMHAANMDRSGSFGYQNILKSESSQPLRRNEPYLKNNIPSEYMSRSSTVNQMRHKSDRNMLFDNLPHNNGQNPNVLRNTSPSTVRANQQVSKPSPHTSSAGTAVISHISYANTRDLALSKVYKPPTIPTAISPGFTGSNLNRGHDIVPLKKSLLFSSQRDRVKLSDSERVASPKTKSATSSYTFKDVQLTSTQNEYRNRGQSRPNLAHIQTFHSQKEYDNLATGKSAFRPSVTNNARSYFLSDENSSIQMSALLDRSKHNTDLTPQGQFAKKTMLVSQRAKNMNLPYTTNRSLKKSSQHNIRNKADLNQSLFVQNYPALNLVPGNTIESVHRVSPSVAGTQGTSENSGTSSSQKRPYYLTSEKPYAFKGFAFVPSLQTFVQKTEMHSGQKTLSNSVQYAPTHPHTTLNALAQKPLMRKSYQKAPFQFKDIETSQEKQPLDQTDSFDNGPQHATVSSTVGASNPMSNAPKPHVVKGQAVLMKTSLSGTNTSARLANNGAVFLQNHPKTGYGGLTVDIVQSKTSQKWTSSRLASAHSLKKHERLLSLTKETKDGNTAGITQSNITESYSPMRLRPTSSTVNNRWAEVTQEGKRSEEISNHQNVSAIPTYQSAIYRAADINRHKTNSSAKLTYQSPIHRSAIKTPGKANLIQSQGSRPTSSFVVGRYINKFDKTSAKSNINMSSTKMGLNAYKPVQFSDIAGSAYFTNAAGNTAKKEVDPESKQYRSNSTSVIEESMISSLQNETDDRTVDLSVPELMPTAAIALTKQSPLPFTEEYTPRQPTVYSSWDLGNLTSPTAEGTNPLSEGTLIPNTTLLVKLTSD